MSRMVEWSDGRRKAILFVVEEETKTSEFSLPFGALLSGFGGIDGNGSCGSGCHFLEGGR